MLLMPLFHRFALGLITLGCMSGSEGKHALCIASKDADRRQSLNIHITA